MNTATTADAGIDLSIDSISSDNALTRLLALAMDKVQRRRHRPKKQGRLHRV